MEYLDARRVLLTYHIPLTEILVDFYDQLKSRTQGYASLDYRLQAYRAGDLVQRGRAGGEARRWMRCRSSCTATRPT